jgi:ribosome maturation factor RimP
MGTVLDVEVPDLQHYNLQVSSPGLDRPLTKPADYRGALGRQIRVSTREPIGNRRNFTGELLSVAPAADADASDAGDAFGEGRLILRLQDDAGEEHVIPIGSIKRANIVYQWPATGAAARNVARGRSGRKR